MSLNLQTKVKNQVLNQLVWENCLRFGRAPKLNNRKINHYIFGTRDQLDVFKFYELRYLLLKIYPLIHNLFLQARLNDKKRKKLFFPRNLKFDQFATQLPEEFRAWPNFQILKKKFNRSLAKTSKPILPKILFATTNEAYSEIVSSAARMCHMPFHIHHWVSGAITARSSPQKEKEKWFFLQEDWNEQTQNWFQKTLLKNKKNTAQQKQQTEKYQLSRKPSLIILPDVSNNEKIIRETNAFGIPVLGLVNSNCQNSIAYPIFANDQSVYSVHFFCHFLSALITKEIVKTKHKFQNASKNTIGLQFPQALRNIWKFSAKNAQSELETHENKDYVFPGKYFVDQFVKPRFLLRKGARIWWRTLPRIKKKKDFWEENFTTQSHAETLKKIALSKTTQELKTNPFFQTKAIRDIPLALKNISLNSLFFKPSPKFKSSSRTLIPDFLKRNPQKMIFFDTQRREILLKRMNFLLRFQKISFAKIQRQVRLPAHIPHFHFWKQSSKFYYRTPMKFVLNTAVGFHVKRFTLRKNFRKVFRQRFYEAQKFRRNFRFQNKRKKIYLSPGHKASSQKNPSLIKNDMCMESNKFHVHQRKNQNLTHPSMLYRKRWPSKQQKKK